MKYLAFITLAMLAGCALNDQQLLAKKGIPDTVLSQLPEGVSDQNVGLESGCYMYDDPNGNVILVTDESGRPICAN